MGAGKSCLLSSEAQIGHPEMVMILMLSRLEQKGTQVTRGPFPHCLDGNSETQTRDWFNHSRVPRLYAS